MLLSRIALCAQQHDFFFGRRRAFFVPQINMAIEKKFVDAKTLPPAIRKILEGCGGKGFVVKLAELKKVRDDILKLSAASKATLTKDIAAIFANKKGPTEVKQAVDAFYRKNYPRQKVQLGSYSQEEVLTQALRAHALSVFQEFKKTIQLLLLDKLAAGGCPPGPETRVEKDADRLAELSKDFIKAVKLKINPECPICFEGIPSGVAAQCRHTESGARHILHLECAQQIEYHARREGSARVRCPMCRLEMLRHFQRIQIDGEDILSVRSGYFSREHSLYTELVSPLLHRARDALDLDRWQCFSLYLHLFVAVTMYMVFTTEATPASGVLHASGLTFLNSLCFTVLPETIPEIIRWFACFFLLIGIERGGIASTP